MGFHVYMLRCANGSLYAGHTDNLEARVAAHRRGLIPGYTRQHRPVRLVWSEELPTREEALQAELRLKRWSRAKKEALVAKDWSRLKALAAPPSERAQRGLLLDDGGSARR